jgi:hypothetical protein
MFVYNVTLKIDKSVATDWLQWMKTKHIPDVLATGLFIENRLFQVMLDEEDGLTYSVQYTFDNADKLELYMSTYAPKLQLEHRERYADKFVAFRTILKEVL